MKRLALALLVSLAVTGSTALAGPTATTGSIPFGWSWVPSARTVGVVGDSLVYEAEHGPGPDLSYERHYLTDQLNAQGWFARIAARSGADTRSLSMWGGWQSPPQTIVMALGSNDRRWTDDLSDPWPLPLGVSQWNVVNYLNRWPSACPVLVGIVEAPNRWRHNVYGPYWNQWLRNLAVARGGVFVDWWGRARSHPEWFTADLLHQTEAGQVAYRQAITEGVGQCL